MEEQLSENSRCEKETDEGVCKQHLEFIESTINRMSKSSFQAKTWCITIIAALIAFYLTQDSAAIHVIAVISSLVLIVLFLAVDAYYLHLERGYRHLYKLVAKLDIDDDKHEKKVKHWEKDESKKRDEPVRDYDMERPASQRGFKKYIGAMASRAVWPFYLVLALLQIGLLVYALI